MITQKQFKDHYTELYNCGAIYVWGANGEMITKELMDKLYKSYGSTRYNRKYYDDKLKEGAGKIGADCSGSIFPLSKKDNTAKGYYQACTMKGGINGIPMNIACLVFNKDFTHVGAYLGNGMTIEMMSSAKNCVKQQLNKSRWAYWGVPSWLETKENKVQTPSISENYRKTVIKNIQEWCNNRLDNNITVDGVYGPQTKRALCLCLQKYINKSITKKIKLTGVFDDETKAVCTVANGKSDLVYICQAMLYAKNYNLSGSITNYNLDGIMGKNTINAITLFQQNTRGLRQDGKCGPATFQALFN